MTDRVGLNCDKQGGGHQTKTMSGVEHCDYRVDLVNVSHRWACMNRTGIDVFTAPKTVGRGRLSCLGVVQKDHTENSWYTRSSRGPTYYEIEPASPVAW